MKTWLYQGSRILPQCDVTRRQRPIRALVSFTLQRKLHTNMRRMQLLGYRITPHTTHTFIHHNTYVKEGVRVINGYIKQNFFTLMLWVRGVRGSEHLSLVGSYCLLSCHHDDVMMIAIMITYLYQLMFKNRLPVLVIGITCTVTLITINTVSL